jgi:DNA topoisomerase-2
MSVADTYRKHTHREHVLALPDTYVGSIETAADEVFLRNGDSFEPITIPINPGFYKLIDELLVNAHDHVIRLLQKKSENPVKHVDISCTDTSFTIRNDGEAIDVVEHPQHKVWVPQMIFSELLTSTNYDKDEKKLVGGKNGYGVKLVNIFASQMTVTVLDSVRLLKYTQTFRNNMTVIEPPVIKMCKQKSFVQVEWTPDFARFGYTNIPKPMQQLIERRVWDLAMTLGKDVKVSFNETLIKCKNLTEYAKAYGCETVVYEEPNDRWKIAISDSPTDKFFAMSFVNGVWTSKNGTHVDGITTQVVNHIVEYLDTKKKIKVKPGLVRENLAVFVTCMVENPSFTSQTKETLTTKAAAFGSSFKLSEDTLKKIQSKLKLVETLIEVQREKDGKENKKSDGRKQTKITGIPKLEDAAAAGTAKSASCTLILTEGDSAKAMALSGLSQDQRKTFGVFPLRGKLLNVKDTSSSKVELAKEIAELKKILGLESGKKYLDLASLRYGSILIMTDQDFDGSHIRGLLVNLFHELWHELIKVPGFITFMSTPIVKASKAAKTQTFYTQYEYEQWRKTDASKGWKVKYYKGLGTSTRAEAQEYFKDPNVVKFEYSGESDQAIDLALNKARANDRKEWLLQHDPATIIVPRADKKLSYDEFIHKDLIHFSYYNLERSIPSAMDGLKTSQRKILYAAFKRKLTTEIRVAQFAGYVSEHTGYHHGEASLNETIIGMSQTFVGSNNVNWFVPEGQFGTRLEGGKDSASPRYIHTYLCPHTQCLVPAKDFPVLEYRDDDGMPVEPVHYLPILPMILVNGARGIGTGFSTFVPQFNPDVMVDLIEGWLDTKMDAIIQTAKIVPWTRGFKGTVLPDGKGDYIVRGVWSYAKKVVKIRELPIGTWTSEYKAMLTVLEEEGKVIKEFTDMSTDQDVHFDVTLVEEMSTEAMIKALGLEVKIKLSNMHLFNAEGVIQKYASPNEILMEYVRERLALYVKRREFEIADIKTRLPYHENVVRFVKMQTQVPGPLPNLHRKTRAECEILLAETDFVKIDDSFEYLMRLPVSSFTSETIAKHETDLAKLRQQLYSMEQTTPEVLWQQDLRMWKESKV